MKKSELKILLFYDNDEELKKIGKYLETHYKVAFAATIKETFESINSFHPEVVIVPLELKTVDGVNLIKQLLSKRHNYELIVLSRKQESVAVMTLNKLGVFCYLNSPISLKQLVFNISQIEEKVRFPDYWQASQYIEIERLKRTFIISITKKNAKSALITSASAGEGKTYFVQNLARNLAKNYQNKFLLIDVNHLNPALHHYFNLEQEIGLTDYLVGNKNWRTLIKSSEYSNLKVITNGGSIQPQITTPNVENLKQLINEAQQQFDLVLMDCAPVQAYNRFSLDPLTISRFVDSSFLVVLLKRTRKDNLLTTISQFERVGSIVDGIILNNLLVSARSFNWKKIIRPGFLKR